MSRSVLLFDEADGLRRGALIVSGVLQALEIDVLGDNTPRPGAIHHAKVTERIPALGAAFLDLGGARGFLPDVAETKAGDNLAVEVRREAEGDKAARVAVRADIPVEAGAPGLLQPGPDAFARLLSQADPITPIETTPALREAVIALAGRDVTSVANPFDHHDVEPQIEALVHPRADLPGGAWITIEPTAALIAIDVNTGALRGGDARLKANLAAAEDIPRQLRLRRLGGAIAIDFAGGPTGKSRKRIAERLAQAGGDLTCAGWGPNGWLEARRPKPGRTLAELLRK